MESGAQPRDRVLEGEPISSSQDGVIREFSSTNRAVSPAGSTKPPERKREHQSSRGSIVPAPHRSSHSSSSGGALDLQAVIGRSSSSSITGMTVPIRLDALSYLLNNAVMGNSRMSAQAAYCQPAPPMCSFPQMGCSPYGMCMAPQYCAMAFSNQYPAYQAGLMPCGSQQSMQACQHQVPNFNQSMSGTAQNQNQGPFSGVNPQSGMACNPTGMACNPAGMAFNSTGMASNSTGMAFNATGMASNTTGMAFSSAGTSSAQNSSGTAQSESTNWAKKPYEIYGSGEKFGGNERSGSNWRSSVSSESEKQSSPPRRGFGRFGNKNEEGWSGRQQPNSFGRDFGRGRGNFGGSSWRGNSRGQNKDWTFGDRSRNVDFGSKRRFGSESPERFQDRGSFPKRGRWPGGRGRGGESPDPWQQKNMQKDSPVWSSTADTSNAFSMGLETKTAATSNAGDEDWETDYPAATTASKSVDPSVKPDVQSSVPCSPKNKCEESVNDSNQVLIPDEELAEVLATSPEVEEPETDSSSEKGTTTMEPEALAIGPEVEEPQTDNNSGKGTATMEPEAKAEERDSTLSPVISPEQRQQDGETFTLVFTVDGEENQNVLVEVNGGDL